jgi:hypothetical protein
MNWGYRVAAHRVGKQAERKARSPVIGHIPLADVRISFPAGSETASVRSLALEQSFTADADGDGRRKIVLPQMREGDVLLLE